MGLAIALDAALTRGGGGAGREGGTGALGLSRGPDGRRAADSGRWHWGHGTRRRPEGFKRWGMGRAGCGLQREVGGAGFPDPRGSAG